MGGGGGKRVLSVLLFGFTFFVERGILYRRCYFCDAGERKGILLLSKRGYGATLCYFSMGKRMLHPGTHNKRKVTQHDCLQSFLGFGERGIEIVLR
jgi:hypothetical protein